MIRIPVTGPTTRAALEQMEQAVKWADLIELRLDAIDRFDLPELLRRRPCPVIVTNRPRRQGGRADDNDEAARTKPLLQAVELGAEYVDFELDAVGFLPQNHRSSKIIVSHHDFAETPDDLEQICRGLADSGADVVKLAVTANSLHDCFALLALLRQAERATIAVSMGPAGLISRVLVGRFPNAYLTYAALDQDHRTAPGQVSASVMRDVYRTELIDQKTALYGLLAPGANRRELIGPMNEALRNGGRNAVFVPLECTGRVMDLLTPLAELGFEGLLVEPALSGELDNQIARPGRPGELAQKADLLVNNKGTWQADYIGRNGEDRIRAALAAWRLS